MSARRPWAWPLVPVYSAALAVQRAARRAGLLQTQRLEHPVVSVGSVSAGGAGKTPVVIALSKLLASRGWNVDILSRGYGRSGREVERVDLLMSDAARRFGDEPCLIAERTGLPVWVGAGRFAAGQAAEGRLSCAPGNHGNSGISGTNGTPEPCLHLLDDGLQHRSLTRSFDLVLVTAEDLTDVLLPAGNLREPLSVLRSADALAVREDEVEAIAPRVRELAGADAPLWTVRRALRFPQPLGVFGAGLRPLAFCALARPANFQAMLADAGCGVVDTVVFRDHHVYEEHDIREIVRLARTLRATGLVTTEKDAVKLTDALRARLTYEIGPVMTVALDAGFVYEAPVARAIEAKLRGPAPAIHTQAARVP